MFLEEVEAFLKLGIVNIAHQIQGLCRLIKLEAQAVLAAYLEEVAVDYTRTNNNRLAA